MWRTALANMMNARDRRVQKSPCMQIARERSFAQSGASKVQHHLRAARTKARSRRTSQRLMAEAQVGTYKTKRSEALAGSKELAFAASLILSAPVRCLA